MAHYRPFPRRLPAHGPAARLGRAEKAMLMSLTPRRNRPIALLAALALVAAICGYGAHDLAGQPGHSCHCDWTMHFTGVAGSAPHPVAVVKPVLAAWRVPLVAAAAPRSERRLRAHLARAPPPALSIG